MIQLGMSQRDKRTLILGVTVVGGLFTLSRGVPLLSEWQRVRIADAADLSARASSAEAAVRLLPALRDTLYARSARLAAFDSVMLRGVSASSAAARLAALLDELSIESRVKINAMQLRGDSAAAGALTTVGVRLTAVTDVAGLAGFLRAVEGDETPMVVRELNVAQSEPAAPETKLETLRIDIVIEGIARITLRPSEKSK